MTILQELRKLARNARLRWSDITNSARGDAEHGDAGAGYAWLWLPANDMTVRYKVRKAIADKARKRWSDPAYKERVLQKVRESCTTDAFRKKMSKITKVIANQPAEVARRSARAVARWSKREIR